MVLSPRLELGLLSEGDFKSPAATNYAMRACMIYTNLLGCNRLKRQ